MAKIKQLQKYTENVTTDGIQLNYTITHNLKTKLDNLSVDVRDYNSDDVLVIGLTNAVDDLNEFIISSDAPIKAGTIQVLVR